MLIVIFHFILSALGLALVLYFMWGVFWQDDDVAVVEWCVAMIQPINVLVATAATAWGVYSNEVLRAEAFVVSMLLPLGAILANMYFSTQKRRRETGKASHAAYWTVCIYVWLFMAVEFYFYFALR